MSLYHDPISDFLTRIRNGMRNQKTKISAPHSRLKVNIARVLKNEHFITDFKVRISKEKKREISVFLKYEETTPAINGIKRISKPGLRVYASAAQMPQVLNGIGIAVVSTNEGIMTNKLARKKRLGGEVIAYVW